VIFWILETNLQNFKNVGTILQTLRIISTNIFLYDSKKREKEKKRKIKNESEAPLKHQLGACSHLSRRGFLKGQFVIIG
jgi:hypothetical protein